MLPGESFGAAAKKAGSQVWWQALGSLAWSAASGGQLHSEGPAMLSGVGGAGRAALQDSWHCDSSAENADRFCK